MRPAPVYIHEQPDWPALRWDERALATPLAAVRHRQGRLLGSLEALGFEHRSQANIEVLTSDVLKSSAIEGEILRPGEVRSSLARRLGLETAGLPRASRAVEGIVEMLLDATRNAASPLTRERLLGWHAALFPTGRSGLLRITVGAWRPREAGPMQVVSGAPGYERVHFEAPAAERLELEIQRFLDWFDAAPTHDPVLHAGLAHLWFVTIHPFEDGNGRIGRAIADQALARADGIPERFYSLSTQLEAERRSYYDELEAAQRGGLDVTRWLQWFLGCLGRAIDNSAVTLAAVVRKARLWQRLQDRPVQERQRTVLNRLLDGFEGHLTSSKYAKLANCSPDTALRDIQELIGWGVLRQNPAGGRSTNYGLADAD